MKGCGEKVWMENAYFVCGEDYGQGVRLCDKCNDLLIISIPISNFLNATKKFENKECPEVAVDIIRRLNQSGYKIVKNDYQEEDICEECIYACDNCEYSCDNCDYYFDAEEDPSDMNCDDCDQADDCDAYKK